jgi:integrase
MRFPKPFFRTSKKSWYLQLGKRQVSLGADRDKAFEHYRRLLLHETGQLPSAEPASTVGEIFDLFLEWAATNLESYAWYRHFLQKFADAYGSLRVEELKPFHVTRWLTKKTWGPTTQNKVIGILKRALSWSEKQGLLDSNPLKHLTKPASKRRERVLTDAERAEILGAARGRAFREFLLALQETGARPGEIRRLSREHIDLDNALWVFTKHKTSKRTRKPRVIYLTPAMLDLTRTLLARVPDGPLFRNSRGKPWTRNAIRCRFTNLRRKLPHLRDVVAYSYRHTFTTDGLERGVPIATMAELLGHSSTAMISTYYSHLAEKREYLRSAAIIATQAKARGCASVPAEA